MIGYVCNCLQPQWLRQVVWTAAEQIFSPHCWQCNHQDFSVIADTGEFALFLNQQGLHSLVLLLLQMFYFAASIWFNHFIMVLGSLASFRLIQSYPGLLNFERFSVLFPSLFLFHSQEETRNGIFDVSYGVGRNEGPMRENGGAEPFWVGINTISVLLVSVSVNHRVLVFELHRLNSSWTIIIERFASC